MKKSNQYPRRTRAAGLAIALLLLGILPGCRFYYKVQTVGSVTRTEVRKYDSLGKYLILHQGDRAWHFSRPVLAGDTVAGILSVLPEYRHKYLTTKPSKGNRYIRNKKPDELYVLEEVHLYVADSTGPKKYDSGAIRIACTGFEKAEIYVKDKGRTTTSWLLPGLGIPVLLIGTVAVLAVTVEQPLGHMNIGLSH